MLARFIRQCSPRISRSLAKSISIKHLVKAKVSPQIDASPKMTRNMKEFILELNTPFEELDCQEAFDGLTETERKYLHFYTKVSESAFPLFMQDSFLRFLMMIFCNPGQLVRLVDFFRANFTRSPTDLLVVSSNHCSRGR